MRVWSLVRVIIGCQLRGAGEGEQVVAGEGDIEVEGGGGSVGGGVSLARAVRLEATYG